MTGISEELVQRMVALVRVMSLADENEVNPNIMGSGCYDAYSKAKAIAAKLPAPVDPDAAFAQELWEKHRLVDQTTRSLYVRGVCEGIKRGRELAITDAAKGQGGAA